MRPKTKQPKGGASVGGATTAPTDDTHLETNVDGNNNTIHDALVEKLLTVQQNVEGGQFHARDNHGTDRTPDQPLVHTVSS